MDRERQRSGDTIVTFFVRGGGSLAFDRHIRFSQPATVSLSLVLADGTDLAAGLTAASSAIETDKDLIVFAF